ncbi:MAG TPA: biotin--[acetyl-CoA-carboxylase] ligase [Candidatus Wallbacteria bacterium]|nr:MAG: Bifunctional ligase/repressor BirA [bacterium ADurb.Bin243]HPG56555.1 biotin--[acetyl-CoA-carboxylase] ligase [Candidatus Wallbacteria bacterium]
MNDINFAVTVVKATGSTNDDLEALAKSDIISKDSLLNFHGYTEIAFSQTAGRGRFDREWDSGHGGLYQSTLLFMEALPGIDFSKLTIITALAACGAIEKLLPEGILRIKWPNDITAGGKKICGMLLKAMPGITGTPVIIGIGVNVFNQVDRSKLRNANILQPGNLEEFASRKFGESDIIELSGAIGAALNGLLKEAAAGGYERIFSDYNSRLLYKGEKITLYNRVEEDIVMASGIFCGLDENGFLKIENADTKEIKSYPSGEIRRIQ